MMGRIFNTLLGVVLFALPLALETAQAGPLCRLFGNCGPAGTRAVASEQRRDGRLLQRTRLRDGDGRLLLKNRE